MQPENIGTGKIDDISFDGYYVTIDGKRVIVGDDFTINYKNGGKITLKMKGLDLAKELEKIEELDRINYILHKMRTDKLQRREKPIDVTVKLHNGETINVYMYGDLEETKKRIDENNCFFILLHPKKKNKVHKRNHILVPKKNIADINAA